MELTTQALLCLALSGVVSVAQSQKDFSECGVSYSTGSGSDVEHRSFCTLYVKHGTTLPFLGGATLIQEHVLLTLGTLLTKLQLLREDEGCQGFKPRVELYARCGAKNLQNPDPSIPQNLAQDIRIKRIFLHPEYNNRSLVNDFALLIAEKPFVYSETVGRACLPTKPFASGVDSFSSCVALGHGRQGPEKTYAYSPTRQKASFLLVERQMCEDDLGNIFMEKSDGAISNWELDSSHLCAKGAKPKFDTCVGDGGGPLYCKEADGFEDFGRSHQEKFVQIGVTAWGVGECGGENPGVYPKVSDSICWIKQVMSCKRPFIDQSDVDLRGDDEPVNGLISDECLSWQASHTDVACQCGTENGGGDNNDQVEGVVQSDLDLRTDDYE